MLISWMLAHRISDQTGRSIAGRISSRGPHVLNRRKTVLHLFDVAGRPVTHAELTMWCFLLRNETPSCGGSAFYDFVPSADGPRSFCLFRDMETMTRLGLVESTASGTWRVAPDGLASAGPLPGAVRRDVLEIFARFGATPSRQLAEHVRTNHPSFVGERGAGFRSGTRAVYTAGYEGLSVDGFLEMLTRRGIKRIVDVRWNPVARRYGFHKGTLRALSNLLGIDYVHFGELGIPSQWRRGPLMPDDYKGLFERYESEILAAQPDAIRRVAVLVAETASVLVCMEANPHRCHRTRLARVVSKSTGLPLRSLEAAV